AESFFAHLDAFKNTDRFLVYARHVHRSQSKRAVEDMIWLARNERLIAQSELDRDPFLLACPNGVLDLKTGVLRAAQPEDLITKLFPVPYESDAPEPKKWLAFLSEIFEEPERGPMSSFLQRVFGYTLTGSVRDEVAFILVGTGYNGKSTVVNVA